LNKRETSSRWLSVSLQKMPTILGRELNREVTTKLNFQTTGGNCLRNARELHPKTLAEVLT